MIIKLLKKLRHFYLTNIFEVPSTIKSSRGTKIRHHHKTKMYSGHFSFKSIETIKNITGMKKRYFIK